MPDIPCRVRQAKREDVPIFDIDGSFVYKKYRSLVRDGKHVLTPSVPSCPLSGWRAVNKDSYQRAGPTIPFVTSGMFLFVTYFESDAVFHKYILVQR